MCLLELTGFDVVERQLIACRCMKSVRVGREAV
jgi:hypothetical protein